MFKNKKIEIADVNLSVDEKCIYVTIGTKLVRLEGVNTTSVIVIYEDIRNMLESRKRHRAQVKEYSKTYDRERQDKSHKKGRKG